LLVNLRREALALAKQPKPEDAFWEDLCFQAQQAAEKAIKYAFETRYPGPFEPVTEDEYQEAVRLAEAVVHWTESIIRGKES